MDTVGSIYILTNPAIRDYVKIGYANDVEERVRVLNSSEGRRGGQRPKGKVRRKRIFPLLLGAASHRQGRHPPRAAVFHL